MFRSSALAGTSTFKLILGLGLCSLGGAMLYVYFKNRDEEEEGAGGAPTIDTAAKKSQKPEKEFTIKLDVANEHIPLIVGRGGGNLSSIEEKTRTKIRFRDKNKTHKVCDITGYATAVKEARALLLKEVERAPIVKEEIYVPQSVCGKIMGRCGEAMQEICRASLAKVAVDSGATHSGGGMDKRRITITGNRQQVNIARKLIEDKIFEDEELRRAVDDAEQRREPRRSPTNSLNSSMYSSQTSLSSHLPPREKLLASRSNEKPMEVYVSAIASPAKFWVQLIGPQTKKLDDMVLSMTEYYGAEANRALHHISEPYLGQIVAAVFKYDGKWYRAEIVGILPNQYNPNEVVLDLYFVDYGDSEYVAPHEVFELRTDFLTLRFQAVECFLANVRSTLINEPDTWEPQSIQKFEELTQVANWKKLISRVVSYKERPKPVNGNADVTTTQRESSPIPGVELYDLTEGVEVNIGHMLISHGYALPASDLPPRSPYAYSSPETSMYQPQGLSLAPQSPALTHSFESLPSTAEDAHMQQQLQHMLQQKQPLNGNGNLYLNGDSNSATTPTANVVSAGKMSADFLNGGFNPAAAAVAASTAHDKHNLNGNLSR